MAARFKLEEFFLKVFKSAVLILMSLALIGMIGMLIAAAYKFNERPHEPEAAKTAPERDVTLEDLKKSLLKKPEAATPPASATPPSAPPNALKYLEDVTRLYRCSIEFARKVNADIDESDSAAISKRVEDLRGQIEHLAEQRDWRGERWVKSATTFACAALADAEIIAWRKEGKIDGVFLGILNFHLTQWDSLQSARLDYNEGEKARVQRERAQEQARVEMAHAQALTLLMAAGAAFAVFMALALYLILAKIELNLRNVNDNFAGFRDDRRAAR